MINHRDRLLLIRQVNPDHRTTPRQHPAKPLPPRIPPPIPPGHATTNLAHKDVLSGCVWDTKPALSHQEDVPTPTRNRQNKPPPARRPITTSRRQGANLANRTLNMPIAD